MMHPPACVIAARVASARAEPLRRAKLPECANSTSLTATTGNTSKSCPTLFANQAIPKSTGESKKPRKKVATAAAPLFSTTCTKVQEEPLNADSARLGVGTLAVWRTDRQEYRGRSHSVVVNSLPVTSNDKAVSGPIGLVRRSREVAVGCHQ